MGLDLDIAALTAPGRKPSPLFAVVRKELAEEDLVMLANASGAEPPDLKRVSERHHALARALASGLSEAEAAALVGYALSRVSILKNSPAFQELLSLYRDQKDTEFAEFHARLAGLSKQAVLELMERLEEAPDSITISQLIEMVKTGADRTGYGPSQKVEQNVNINLSERLEAARRRALEVQERTVIDVTPEEPE
jgi:hypothetical protein